jgi:hypothetical protein
MTVEPSNESYGTRAQRLLLGGFALAFAVLFTLVLATPESPAPLVTAGGDHKASAAAAATVTTAKMVRDSSDETPLVDVQGELIARKNAVVRQLIAGVAEYGRQRDAIYKVHPDLREIPGLLQWLEKMPMERFPQGVKECQALLQQGPEMLGRLFELMVLKRAGVMLAVMDDPKYGPYLDAAFEGAGFNRQVSKDLMVLDTTAGYEGDTQGAATSRAAFRAAYEAREPVYAAAAAAKQAQWGMQVSEAMDQALMANEQLLVMKPVLQRYYDSFFGEAEAATAASVEELQRQLMAFPASIQADPELMSQYREMAEAVQVGPLR